MKTETAGGSGNKRMGTLTIILEDDLYNKVMAVIGPLGYTMERLIKEFIEETVRLGRIPFDYTQEEIEAAEKTGGVEVRWSM